MLQELDVICGKHCNCYLVKDTINKWEPFLLAHMSKLSSLLQFWAPAQYCERRKLRVLNVFSFYFIHSFRNQRRFIPNNNLFVFILPPCLLHLFLAQYFSSAFFLEEKRDWEEEGWKHLPSLMWRCLSLPVQEVLGQISFLSCFQRNSVSVSSAQGSTAAMVREVEGCHWWQQEGGRHRQGAQCDLQSDFHHLRNAVINEEPSLLQRQHLSSIKHHKSQEKGVLYSPKTCFLFGQGEAPGVLTLFMLLLSLLG